MADTLLVYYSRSGYTRKAAREIASACPCDIEELHDKAARAGPLGYLRSAFEAMAGLETQLARAKHAPTSYRLVIVGTPVWFWSLSSPVRTWLRRHRKALPEVAFFCTCGSSGGERARSQLESVLRRKVLASLALTDAEIDSGAHAAKIRRFLEHASFGGPAASSRRTTERAPA